MTPVECIDAVVSAIEGASPTTQRSKRDTFRRIVSTKEPQILHDRQFTLQQTDLPGVPEEWVHCTWRRVALALRIGYGGTPDTDDRVAEDWATLRDLLEDLDASVAGIQMIELLGGSGFVTYDDATGAAEAEVELLVTYDTQI